MNDKLCVRPGASTDTAFILDSWMESFREQSPLWRLARRHYYSLQRAICETILRRAETRVLILSSPDDLDLIYGYAIFEMPRIFHYIYIKKLMCGFHLSQFLIEKAPFTVDKETIASHMTPSGLKLVKKYNMLYNPHAI